MDDISQIKVQAPAKVNLFLQVKEKRADGYHNLDSVMQSITLYDILTFEKRESGTVFDCSDKTLVYAGNLVNISAEAFFEKSGIKGGVSIYLEKHIPVEAGLGGGSTDAAATLQTLNKMYGYPLPDEELYRIGKSLGADVPFCLRRGLCRVEGIGEILYDIGELPECFFVIAKGSSKVSTAEAFKMLDASDKKREEDSALMIEAIKDRDLDRVAQSLYNCFEIFGSYEAEIKTVMEENNALNSVMSGSGPSVVGLFKNANDAYKTCLCLRKRGYLCFECRPERREDEKEQ